MPHENIQVLRSTPSCTNMSDLKFEYGNKLTSNRRRIKNAPLLFEYPTVDDDNRSTKEIIDIKQNVQYKTNEGENSNRAG